MSARYKVATTFRENTPAFYGVYDTTDKSHGFNGRLVSEHETRAAAQTDADMLNAAVQSKVATTLSCVEILSRKLHAAESQRDALLVALQACLTAITVTPRSEMDCFTWSRLADKARAAIAACEVQP